MIIIQCDRAVQISYWKVEYRIVLRNWHCVLVFFNMNWNKHYRAAYYFSKRCYQRSFCVYIYISMWNQILTVQSEISQKVLLLLLIVPYWIWPFFSLFFFHYESIRDTFHLLHSLPPCLSLFLSFSLFILPISFRSTLNSTPLFYVLCKQSPYSQPLCPILSTSKDIRWPLQDDELEASTRYIEF